VERRLTEHLRGSLGLGFDHTITDQGGRTRTFNLVGAPLILTYNNSNSLLDPTRGFRFDVAATPYSRLLGSDLSFTSLRLSPAGYVSLDKSARAVLAVRGSVGSILGVGRDDTPAEHRFYAGGSNTVRGFPYQKAGPLDANGDPIGGLSIVSGSVELRYRLTETIGIVPFIDAATVSDSRLPKLDKSVFTGAGLGVRYYTSFGPIRVDIGLPVNHRHAVGAPFQIYASIGQAF
jgi:translocation and assembly module TamA